MSVFACCPRTGKKARLSAWRCACARRMWLYLRLDPPWLRPSCGPTSAHWYLLLVPICRALSGPFWMTCTAARQQGSPHMVMVRQAKYCRLIEGSRFFPTKFYGCNSPVAPSDFDRLVWGYRLSSDRLNGGTSTAVLCIHTALSYCTGQSGYGLGLVLRPSSRQLLCSAMYSLSGTAAAVMEMPMSLGCLSR